MIRLKDALALLRKAAAKQSSEAAVISLFGSNTSLYGTRPSSFAASALTQISVIGLIILLTTFLAVSPKVRTTITGQPVLLSPYIMKPSSTKSGGGGGGGAAEKFAASKGAPPRQARTQFAPPVVIPPQDAKLVMAPTVVAPPLNITGPQTGDPLSKLMTPSNGTGVTGGIGNTEGGGIGGGHGPGMGPGEGGGVGGGVYRIGGGVSAPRAEYTPDPDYSEEARKAKFQGVVILQVIIGPDGRVHNAKVIRALGMGLDQKALEVTHKWKFSPAEKDGHPVSVVMNVEVEFRLF